MQFYQQSDPCHPLRAWTKKIVFVLGVSVLILDLRGMPPGLPIVDNLLLDSEWVGWRDRDLVYVN